jgi:hypothetical protein
MNFIYLIAAVAILFWTAVEIKELMAMNRIDRLAKMEIDQLQKKIDT